MPDTTLAPVFRWAADQDLATPTHLMCERAVTSAVAHLRSHLDARISYATKANAHPFVLATMRGLVDEFNVTNLAHMEAVLRAGIDPERVCYINPLLTTEVVRTALAAGVNRFVVDDYRGLEVLTRLGADVRVTLRLRPSQDGQATRSVVRFGNTGEAVFDLAVRAAGAGVGVEALSFFVGTHSDDLAQAMPYRLALKELATVHGRLCDAGIRIGTVNIGGGFPGARRTFHRRHPEFFGSIAEDVRTAFGDGVSVVCEPGRFLAEASMAVLTRVVADRCVDGRRMTYLDTSAYAGLFETTFIEPGGVDLPVVTERQGPATVTQLLGPIMDSFDVVKRDAFLPLLTPGDLLLLPNTGAYSWGYAASCEGIRQPRCVALPPELDELVSTFWFD